MQRFCSHADLLLIIDYVCLRVLLFASRFNAGRVVGAGLFQVPVLLFTAVHVNIISLEEQVGGIFLESRVFFTLHG